MTNTLSIGFNIPAGKQIEVPFSFWNKARALLTILSPQTVKSEVPAKSLGKAMRELGVTGRGEFPDLSTNPRNMDDFCLIQTGLKGIIFSDDTSPIRKRSLGAAGPLAGAVGGKNHGEH
jgi:hypothetical protein